MTSNVYGISIVFNERGYWSKQYTYKSNVEYAIDSIVVVPTEHFFSVGKVKKVTLNLVLTYYLLSNFLNCS